MANVSCMGFNVLAYGTAGAEPPQVRYPYVMATITDNNPDLLGVQEACQLGCTQNPECTFDWHDHLIEDLGALGYGHSALRDQEGFAQDKQSIGCGLMIFFKKDRFELKDSGCQIYPHDPKRYFQWVKLWDKEYQKDILFTNTHFSIPQKIAGVVSRAYGNALCTVEAGMLLNFWWEHCDENTALFATGDYNSDPNTEAQTLLRSNRFQPSYLISEIADERNSVNWRNDSHIIDFCYVNPTAQTVKEYHPIVRRFETKAEGNRVGYASDHRAIMTWCDYK